MRILKHSTLFAQNPPCSRRSGARAFHRARSSLSGFSLPGFSLPSISFRAFSWAALATALAGCDGNNSVVHSATLDAKPDLQCMKQALERLPGVSHVAYLHATQDQKEFDELSYQADEQRVMLMVQPDREYRQTFLRLGGGDDAVPRMRRVMAQVDAAVEKACHIRHLSRKIRETCTDAAHPDGKCPPLAPRSLAP